jgi:hypothetical protein
MVALEMIVLQREKIQIKTGTKYVKFSFCITVNLGRKLRHFVMLEVERVSVFCAVEVVRINEYTEEHLWQLTQMNV